MFASQFLENLNSDKDPWDNFSVISVAPAAVLERKVAKPIHFLASLKEEMIVQRFSKPARTSDFRELIP